MKRSLGILVMAMLLTLGCGQQSKQPQARAPRNTGAALKVAVLKTGVIQANGKAVTLTELDELLATSKSRNGEVWYYREAAKEEPPPQATEVIKLVIKHQLPISMSSKPDFSDMIDEHGKSVPRT